MSQPQKPKVYTGRNEEFALASIRYVPKSKNKARHDKKSERRERKQKGFSREW